MQRASVAGDKNLAKPCSVGCPIQTHIAFDRCRRWRASLFSSIRPLLRSYFCKTFHARGSVGFMFRA